ncbi:MAG: hypothetical protein KJ927_07150 [Candidatus Eisenbacteria bacterium]|nr:hypothetical protein [Candidatus Eisenbacteria bacterium]
MQAKEQNRRLTKAITRRNLLVVFVAIVVTFALLGHRQILGYLALYACDRGAFGIARTMAYHCLELDRSDYVARLVIRESFERPLWVAMQKKDYREAMSVACAWQKYTSGRDALPYYRMGSIWKSMGSTNLAAKALFDAMIVHDQNPSEQQLGFLRIFSAAVGLVGESNCVATVFGREGTDDVRDKVE